MDGSGLGSHHRDQRWWTRCGYLWLHSRDAAAMFLGRVAGGIRVIVPY